MLLPIYLYGSTVLRKVSEEITEKYPDLDEFLSNMWETMYNADGVGLAAPQVGKNIRVFIIDASAMSEEYPETKDFKQVFINPSIIEEEGDEWAYSEGCLSVPKIHEDVKRKKKVLLKYCDEHFTEHQTWFDGIIARVIQHEYDHLEGKNFIEKLSPIRKQLLKAKLSKISKGTVSTQYRTKVQNN
ncbi:MAG: peptide deformylase [Bacteroidales bacterium]